MHLKETRAQLMLTLNQLFVSKTRCTGSAASAHVTWDSVVQELVVMKLHSKDDAVKAAAFAAAWSAGDSSPALQEV